MIEKMTKFSVIAFSGDRETVLEQIQKVGLLDITRSVKPCDKESISLMDKANALKSKIQRISKDDFSRDGEWRELHSSLEALQKELDYLKLWGDFDKDKMEALLDSGCIFHYHIVPKKKFNSEWENACPLAVTSDDGKQICFVSITRKDDVESYVIPVRECVAPQGSLSGTALEAASLEQRIKSREEFLRKEKELIPGYEKELRRTTDALDIYLAANAVTDAADGSLAVFTGFTPSKDEDEVCRLLDGMSLYYFKEAATAADNPPIKLRNRWFARQFETLTGMYGMPVYDEFDPTPVLAPFFLLFWSFCMGDAGYGLLLIAVSFILKKKDILGLKNHRRLVATLGAGTFFIGLILGTVFGVSLYNAQWVPSALKRFMVAGSLEIGGTSYDVQMVAALAIGVFHICLAMTIKAVGLTKRVGFRQAVSTWGWVVLIVGGLLVAAGSLAGVLGSTAVKASVVAIGVLSALGIFIFNTPGRNPLLNIGAGLWDTYGMTTGILGDVLSYIRIYALGLAGGMLGGAFNTLADMTIQGAANPTWQYLPFALILLLGHALNFAMSCLGAFVHPLRLTFVEYFKNSGYQGKGLKYNPLKETV